MSECSWRSWCKRGDYCGERSLEMEWASGAQVGEERGRTGVWWKPEYAGSKSSLLGLSEPVWDGHSSYLRRRWRFGTNY